VELATTEFGMEVCMTRYQEAIDKTASVVMKPAKLNMGTIEKMKSRLRAVVRNVKMSLK
jgi:hypothetical protein